MAQPASFRTLGKDHSESQAAGQPSQDERVISEVFGTLGFCSNQNWPGRNKLHKRSGIFSSAANTKSEIRFS